MHVAVCASSDTGCRGIAHAMSEPELIGHRMYKRWAIMFITTLNLRLLSEAWPRLVLRVLPSMALTGVLTHCASEHMKSTNAKQHKEPRPCGLGSRPGRKLTPGWNCLSVSAGNAKLFETIVPGLLHSCASELRTGLGKH
jgi:hypothetical protein